MFCSYRRDLGARPECCEQLPYNPSRQTCCAGEIVPKVAGDSTKCCGTQSYDGRQSSCCDNKVCMLNLP